MCTYVLYVQYAQKSYSVLYVFYLLQCIIVSMGVFLSEIAKARTKCFNKVFLPYAQKHQQTKQLLQVVSFLIQNIFFG